MPDVCFTQALTGIGLIAHHFVRLVKTFASCQRCFYEYNAENSYSTATMPAATPLLEYYDEGREGKNNQSRGRRSDEPAEFEHSN